MTKITYYYNNILVVLFASFNFNNKQPSFGRAW